MVGWQRLNCTRVEYIGLLDRRWSDVEIPYDDRVRLSELPQGFEYLDRAEELSHD